MKGFAQIAVPVPLSPLDASLDYKIPSSLADVIQVGSLVIVPFRSKKIIGVVLSLSDTPSTDIEIKKIKPIDSVKLSRPVLDKEGILFLRWISKRYFYPIGEAIESVIPAPIRNGSEKTLDPSKQKESKKKKSAPVSEKVLRLNEKQVEALESINKSLKPHLLWGVTGSGKTQVYIESIKKALKRGLGAMMLVPEISLTPQLLNRFEEAFGDKVAVFHSGQKPTQIRKAWLDVFYEKKSIVLGARSALFAPLTNLGLIVLDEEHDSSYKQDDRLKYHTKEAAEELAKLRGAKLILGSATPSAETLHKAKQGLWHMSKLPDRATEGSVLPHIELVDLKSSFASKSLDVEELAVQESQGKSAQSPFDPQFFLSPPLLAKITDRLEKKEQSILFLNRRGIASSSVCLKCGTSVECPTCLIPLTPHKKNLSCHYCGHETNYPQTCKTCGASPAEYKQVGVGTEEIEDSIHKEFPSARILRLDRDTAKNKDELEEILYKFSSGEADILVGTQMVAKGHDFPNVTLVGMILADMGLNIPDFRAAERSMQLLLQVAGRAGRAEKPGEVIVQSFNPEHKVFHHLCTYKGLDSYSDFIEEDLLTREVLSYPPYGELVLLNFDGLVLSDVQSAATSVATALHKIHSEKLKVLGPAETYHSRLKGRHRLHILLKSKDPETLHKSVDWISSKWNTQRLEQKFKTRLSIDVSPS